MEVLASEISNEKKIISEEEDDYYEYIDNSSDMDYDVSDDSSDSSSSGSGSADNGSNKQTISTTNSNIKHRKRSKRNSKEINLKDHNGNNQEKDINGGTSATLTSSTQSLVADGADTTSTLTTSNDNVNSNNDNIGNKSPSYLNGLQTSPTTSSSSSTSTVTSPQSINGANSNSGFLSDIDDDILLSSAENNNGLLPGKELPLLNLFQKFLNREAIKKLQQKHMAINNRLEKLKKTVDPSKLREKGRNLRNEKEKIKELIKLKKTELDDHMKAPPFIRLLDKIAFTLGLIILCISEFVLLRSPENMYLWYTFLIFPLMAIRFIMYHREKYHYFMLDFCYLCQILLLFYLFGHQYVLGENTTPNLFKLVFALSNGPLAWGTIVWRNSLVFHDVDKLTSVFIHLCPPIVTYCLRWYPNVYPLEKACGGVECVLTMKENFLVPLYVYFFWQTFYYIKTEVVDRKKLANDKDIMTSSRWMSVKQPHPIYQWCIKRGYNVSPVAILMLVQLLYTLGTVITVPFIIGSFWLHTAFIIFIFVAVSWNGANYYFEVFSENYSSRLKSEIKRNADNSNRPPKEQLKISSIMSFFKFLSIFLLSLLIFLKLIL